MRGARCILPTAGRWLGGFEIQKTCQCVRRYCQPLELYIFRLSTLRTFRYCSFGSILMLSSYLHPRLRCYFMYRMSVKYYRDYKHLLQENYMEYKRIFLPLF
jgi:hypothetical protein